MKKLFILLSFMGLAYSVSSSAAPIDPHNRDALLLQYFLTQNTVNSEPSSDYASDFYPKKKTDRILTSQLTQREQRLSHTSKGIAELIAKLSNRRFEQAVQTVVVNSPLNSRQLSVMLDIAYSHHADEETNAFADAERLMNQEKPGPFYNRLKLQLKYRVLAGVVANKKIMDLIVKYPKIQRAKRKTLLKYTIQAQSYVMANAIIDMAKDFQKITALPDKAKQKKLDSLTKQFRISLISYFGSKSKARYQLKPLLTKAKKHIKHEKIESNSLKQVIHSIERDLLPKRSKFGIGLGIVGASAGLAETCDFLLSNGILPL